MSLTEKEISQQEDLSLERIKKLTPQNVWQDINIASPRPKSSLIDLIHWSNNTFGTSLLKQKENLDSIECCIHNKIAIDGSFLQFCEEKKIKVECVVRDSIASWKGDFDHEHFLMQGIFKIKYKDIQFIHCALFHKGNQNEDEVSFWILVRRADFLDYVKLRNEYDKWMSDRERDHLEVHVVGGEGYPYSKDLSWDDLYLPESLKSEIRNTVEGFLNSKKLYEDNKIPWKKGLLFWGVPGCGKTSTLKILMSQYDFKPVTVMSGSQTNDEVMTEAFMYAQEQEPSLLYIEDLDTLLSGYVTMSHFLNLMDGVGTNSGMLVVATANDPSRLGEAILDRPSRFDRKWEFPTPDKAMTLSYLKKWFGKNLKNKDYNLIVDKCVEKRFSYAYLKEMYITAASNALSNKRERPTLEDVNVALNQMVRDKELVESDFESSDNGPMGLV